MASIAYDTPNGPEEIEIRESRYSDEKDSWVCVPADGDGDREIVIPRERVYHIQQARKDPDVSVEFA